MNMQYAQAVVAHERAQLQRLGARYPTTNRPEVRPSKSASE
ncbi:MAG: hypothetical protein QOF88_5765 [Mycobacterium sp.]|nr:hypothetical protein [Mycobacterium sp.]MDT5290876.1 hypothetical protein [Mycobacterium sp.]